MANHRIFPEPQKSDEEPSNKKRNFEHIATKVFTVPKSEIDKREKQWRKEKPKEP